MVSVCDLGFPVLARRIKDCPTEKKSGETIRWSRFLGTCIEARRNIHTRSKPRVIKEGKSSEKDLCQELVHLASRFSFSMPVKHTLNKKQPLLGQYVRQL